MKRIIAGAVLLGSCSFLFATTHSADAQGLYIGPGGVGVDGGPRYRDDRDYDRDYDRRRYRDRDDDDDRPPPRHRYRRHYEDDDD